MSADTNPGDWYGQRMALLLNGEVPTKPPPPVRVGVQIRSLTRVYDDSDETCRRPLGGVVVDRGEDLPGSTGSCWLTVDQHRGRVHYWTIPDNDIDFGLYTGAVRKDVLKDIAQACHRDSVTHRGHDHLTTLLRLSAAIANG